MSSWIVIRIISAKTCSQVYVVTKLAIYDFSLQDRQLVLDLCSAEQRPNYHETDEGLIPVFCKFHSQGITEEDEDKLLFLRDVVLKLHRAKSGYSIRK